VPPQRKEDRFFFKRPIKTGPRHPAWTSQLRCSLDQAPPDMVPSAPPPKPKILATPLYYYFAAGRGAKYCDEYVWLFVCMSARITRKPHSRTSPNFCACCLLSSSDSVAIYKVLPVLWMTSCFHTVDQWASIKNDVICLRSSPGGGTSWMPVVV